MKKASTAGIVSRTLTTSLSLCLLVSSATALKVGLPLVAMPTFAVLVFSKTTGYRHDSIPAGIAAIQSLGIQNGFEVEATEDASVFRDENLARYRAVVFLNTTGEILNPAEQAAFERFIRNRGGFVGIHSATDTEYDWPWYGRLVGAYFATHPAVQTATTKIMDAAHPSTEQLPPQWIRSDEWYDFRQDPSGNVKVLVTVDETTYSGGIMGANHPISWYHEYDGGRAWYTAMGHTTESYSDSLYLTHIRGGILWAAGVIPMSTLAIPVSPGGVVSATTASVFPSVQAGYAKVEMVSGPPVHGSAVFSVEQNGVIVSEAGVPASPPTTSARIFIDYRTGVTVGPGTIDINTGLAMANPGGSAAAITFTLREPGGNAIASGTGTLAPGNHTARFINQLSSIAPGFDLPGNFPTAIRFGSLEISSSTPVSILALRLTLNQRGETLLTSTPIADLTRPLSTNSLAFPQFVDGGGYATTVLLLNTSSSTQTGRLQVYGDNGEPLLVRQAGGPTAASFDYTIASGGSYMFESDGSPPAVNVGWAEVIPAAGTSAPIGAGMFRFSQDGIVVTESGVPSATPTTRARIYVDTSDEHDTGVALASSTGGNIALRAFRTDGVSPAGDFIGPLVLGVNGHTAGFVGQIISGLPRGFVGVVEISSPRSFVALTLRSLVNARGNFLLTTLPIADGNQPAPSPIVFPQIADGGGYKTEIILISAGTAANMTVSYFGSNGSPWPVGR